VICVGRRGVLMAIATMLVACEHPQPFVTPPIEPNPPQPALGLGEQLTHETSTGQEAAWLPDGSEIGYSWPRPGRTDGDRCLALLSLTTRRISRLVCVGGAGDNDSTSLIRAHAVSAGGRIAFVTEGRRVAGGTSTRTLRVGRFDHAEQAPSVLTFPLTPPGTSLVHVTASQLIWQGESTLVYLAMGIESGPARRTAGLEIARIRLDAAGPAIAVVPNTTGATSVAVDPATGVLYGTFAGDPLLYALDGVTGARQVVADFSALLTPRDVNVVNGRIVAVVQGRVYPDSGFGTITEFDEGGELAVGQVGGGPPALLISQTVFWFRHPVLSPGGDRIVVEYFDLDIHARYPGMDRLELDTVAASVSNLMLIANP